MTGSMTRPSRGFKRRLGRWLRPRSAGVPVSRATLRRIDRGDAGRDGGDWAAAAAGFEAALALDPGLAHIWIQLGHARRESGAADAARRAYAEACRRAPGDRETQLILADLARASGDREGMLTHMLAVFRLGPDNMQARMTLVRALSSGQPGHDVLIAEIAATTGVEPFAQAAEPGSVSPSFWVDIGDLIDHFVNSRLPSGLQRLEIEAARAMIQADPAGIGLCCYAPFTGTWKPLPADRFEALITAALAGGDADDPGWQRILADTMIGLAATRPIGFACGSTLFNLGMAWGDCDYHPRVAAAKEEYGVRFAALACDVIPLVRPHQLPGDIVEACGRWLDDLARVADRLVAISRATRDDIVRVSRERGHAIAMDRVRVVPLDVDFRPVAGATATTLARWKLGEGNFVLYTSTVEPRKNHLAAFAAWERLIAEFGEDAVPVLVCVGRMGWMSAPVEAMLVERPGLACRVRMLSGITDAELDLLYRNCAFTLYPSLHEGWGLPVTEALCYGKVPAIGCNSSLPEAGGRFAVYYDASSPQAIAAAVAPLIRDPAARAAREAAIRDGFHPRRWGEIAADMVAAARMPA